MELDSAGPPMDRSVVLKVWLLGLGLSVSQGLIKQCSLSLYAALESYGLASLPWDSSVKTTSLTVLG